MSDIDDRLYQMLLCDENAEIKTEHSSTLWHEETAWKQNATQTGRVFITEVIPRPKWFYLHVGKDDVRCRRTTSLTHVCPPPSGKNVGNGLILSGSTVGSHIYQLTKTNIAFHRQIM